MTELNPVLAEAVKKAQIAWVTTGAKPAACVWCLWAADALLLVCGPGEQADPGLAEAARCEVTLRGDHNGRIVDFTALVERVRPGDESWDETAGALAAKRLNATGDDTVARWGRECAVYRLVPDVDAPAKTGTALPSDDLAATVVDSPAARPTRKPFRLHRVKPKAKRR